MFDIQSLVIVTPSAPLAPSTTYEVLDFIAETPCDDPATCKSDTHPPRHVRDGHGHGYDPAVVPGSNYILGEYYEELVPDSCGWAYAELPFRLIWDNAIDASELYYEVRYEGTEERRVMFANELRSRFRV